MSRIYQYPVVTEIGSDDYVALGSVTNGSRAILASDLAPVIGTKTITERGTYKASDDNMDGYGQVTVDIPYTDIHVASGDIATFEGEDLPLKSLKVAVTPYQDLHGYDAPWAGGAGKNKFDVSDIFENKSLGGSDGQEQNSSYRNTSNYILVNANSDYVLSLVIGTPAQAGVIYICFYDANKEFISSTYYSAQSGTITKSFATPNNTVYVRFAYDKNSSNIQLESGSTATTFAPYSNICPIIGWDEANVTRCGANIGVVKNLYVGGTSGLAIGNDGVLICFNAIKGQTYRLSGDRGNRKNLYKFSGSIDEIVAGASMTAMASGTELPFTFTADETCVYCYYANNTWSEAIANTLMVSVGESVIDYAPYNGATYTIDLDGTRYGGVLDATNGTMLDTLDHIASYNGETLPSTWISDRDVYAEGTTPTIGAEVVYPRATPITVQLAPTPVKSLEGENNIFANCGAVDVEYQTVWVRPTN